MRRDETVAWPYKGPERNQQARLDTRNQRRGTPGSTTRVKII